MSFSHSCGEIIISTRFTLLHEHKQTQAQHLHTLYHEPSEWSILDVSWELRESKKLQECRQRRLAIKILLCSVVIDVSVCLWCNCFSWVSWSTFQLLFMWCMLLQAFFLVAYSNQKTMLLALTAATQIDKMICNTKTRQINNFYVRYCLNLWQQIENLLLQNEVFPPLNRFSLRRSSSCLTEHDFPCHENRFASRCFIMLLNSHGVLLVFMKI